MRYDLQRSDQEAPATQQESNLPTLHSASDIDTQIRTANAFPRNINAAMLEARALVLDPSVARSAWYRLERKDYKTGEVTIIEGPSIRLAEVVAYAWRNLRYGGNIIEETQTYILAEGIAIDLERNVAARVCVRRGIMGKRGRYPSDLINQVSQAAMAIAIRNAIFKVVPGAFVKPLLDAAQQAVRAEPGELKTRVDAMLDYFAREHNVTTEEVIRYLGKDSQGAIDKDDLIRLRGVVNALRDNESQAYELFRRPFEEAKHDATEERLRTGVEIPPKPAAESSPPKQSQPEPQPEAAPLKQDVPDKPIARVMSHLMSAGYTPAQIKRLANILVEACTLDDTEGKAQFREDVLKSIVAAPKSVVLASLADEDPLAALLQIAEVNTKAERLL